MDEVLGARVWVRGARPRTLVASVCPVLVGTAAAAALVVSVAIQVGVNYANDYSDGVRGADPPERIGPARLVASGLASPAQVRRAAAIAFAVAVAASLPVGLAAVAILLANNIRDLGSDRAAGKRTLVVRLGRARSRALFVATLAAVFVLVALIGLARPPALLALAALPLAAGPVRLVRYRQDGPGLVAALAGTARLQLAVCVFLSVGLWLS